MPRGSMVQWLLLWMRRRQCWGTLHSQAQGHSSRVREAEAATVRGALLTFSELQIHMADRGRPFPPDSVDLDAFLFDGTGAQSRALAGLKWLVKAGELDHDLSASGASHSVNPARRLRDRLCWRFWSGRSSSCIMPGTLSGEPCWAFGRVALVCCGWFT